MAQSAGEAAVDEAALLSRLARRARLYGRRHLRGADRAEELAQRVVLVTLAKLRAGEVRDPDRVGSFALGTARRIALEMLRGEGRTTSLDDAQLVAAAPTPADPLDLERLARCMEALSDRERTVTTLGYYAERSSAQIAADLGTSEGNVRVIRHRAITRLRECMDPEEGGR